MGGARHRCGALKIVAKKNGSYRHGSYFIRAIAALVSKADLNLAGLHVVALRSPTRFFGIGVALALIAARCLRQAADDCRPFGSS
jgi:hypothetical protein